MEGGMEILSTMDRTVLKSALSSNAKFYLERILHRYIIIDHPSTLSQKDHNTCLMVLDELVENASAVAYQLCEMLLKSKRIL